ncbi:glycosyltransferase [Vibrio tritonius]|uniref:glycosyltransferase n=1 Tax=Vibrio tritonius TaxID=1435069 RepID=UPI00315DBB3E
MTRIKISVLITVYNESCEWFCHSLKSMVNQYIDGFISLEIIVVIDNPKKKDFYYSIIDEIRLPECVSLITICNDKNIGLAKSLNKAFLLSSGDYIARMDADDISIVDRLYKQYKYYLSHDVDILGSSIERIDEDGNHLSYAHISESFDSLLPYLGYRALCYHPTWFMSRDVFESIEGYRPYPNSQDLDFIFRAIDKGFVIGNVPEVLLKYRINTQSLSFKKSLRQRKCQYHIIRQAKRRSKGLDFYSEDEMNNYISSSRSLEYIHYLSQKLFSKATNRNENLLYRFFLLLCSVLMSPYQAKHVFRMINFKFKRAFRQ